LKRNERLQNVDKQKMNRVSTRSKRLANQASEEAAIKGLNELLKTLWIESSYSSQALEQPEVNSKKQVKEKPKMNLRKRQVEIKKGISQEVIPEPAIKVLSEQIPEPMIETEVKKEIEPVVRERLPSVNPNTTLPLYPPYEITSRTENPLLPPNNQLNYVLYNPLYRNDPIADSMTPHFQQSRPDIPKPIFNHCAIHAGIAYFIQAIQKREVLSCNS
jgi:hypothetical protein